MQATEEMESQQSERLERAVDSIVEGQVRKTWLIGDNQRDAGDGR